MGLADRLASSTSPYLLRHAHCHHPRLRPRVVETLDAFAEDMREAGMELQATA